MCAYSCRRRVATAALLLLSLISNQHSQLKPKVIYGHRRFCLFLPITLSLLSVHSSSPAILFRHFTLRLCPCSCSLLHSVYFHHFPRPKACPPLAPRLSVNSFFLFLVCWPRLTYFSLSPFQLSLSRSPSLPLLLSSIILSETKQHLHMCPHTHTYCMLYMCMQTDVHTRPDGIHPASNCFHDNMRTHIC